MDYYNLGFSLAISKSAAPVGSLLSAKYEQPLEKEPIVPDVLTPDDMETAQKLFDMLQPSEQRVALAHMIGRLRGSTGNPV